MKARILLLKAECLSINAIADTVDMKYIMLCINKSFENGAENTLFGSPNSDHDAEITDDEKA